MHTLIESFFSNPMIRITDAARRLNVTYPTAKSDILKLVDLGILTEMRDTAPKAYFSPAIFNAAYREDTP